MVDFNLLPSSTIQARWYQDEAVDALFDYFDSHGGTGPDGLPIRANPLVCLPTGTGKSLVIAKFLQRAFARFPGTRAFMSTHVKELISQNAAKMREVWPLAPLGVYSAGLNVRDCIQPIIFGGVQSCVKKFPMFGRRDLLLVDEAHLIGDEGNYLKFIQELQWGEIDPAKALQTHEAIQQAIANAMNYNPYLKVIGFSATAYRLGMGCMTNGKIFTDIAYNLCTMEGFNRLISEGYLCTLVPRPTEIKLDVTGVGLSKGDFQAGALQAAVDKQEVTYAALKEMVELGQNRHSWLIFASGVEHAEHIAEMLNSIFGIPTVCIHSKRTDAQNAASLKAWKNGEARAAVNMNSLTTGVDHPACDLIGMFRPTMSTGLWVQMLGRGTRPMYSPGFDLSTIEGRLSAIGASQKQNCLVLDFARNTRRLGPINDPLIPKPKGKGPPGDAPVKICPTAKGGCGNYNHSSAKTCFFCGFEFPKFEQLDKTAGTDELVRAVSLPEITGFEVDRVVMVPHLSRSTQRKSIKVAYYCGLKTFYEYVSVESPIGMFKKKSRDWFRQRYHYQGTPLTWGDDVPAMDAEVLALSASGELRAPKIINVWFNKENPEIMSYEF